MVRSIAAYGLRSELKLDDGRQEAQSHKSRWKNSKILNSKQIQITKIQMTKNNVESRLCVDFFLALGDNAIHNRISRGGDKSVGLINKKSAK